MDEEAPSQVVDTHVSTVVLVDGYALKRKRPVRTEFLDFSTPEAREAACRREVELNRRLAPDVYLGVADLVLDDEVLDRVVVMRRLPEQRRLANLLDDPGVHEHLRRLASLIADFHARARRGPDVDAASGVEAVAGLWSEGIEQVRELGQGIIEVAELDRVELLAAQYLDGRRPLFDRRVRERRACDGHGDLQAEDVFCLEDGPRVLDCVEFADRFRFGDVLADVAFLAMDLERLGRADLGREFLDAYRSASGDAWPATLEHHHIAYRAHVRAKVACMRVRQGAPAARRAAVDLHALARRHLEAGQVQLVLVGGSPGTGKSTLATALGGRLGAVVASSDRVRDEVEPRSAAPNDELRGGRYTPERLDRVYGELLERAGTMLALGEHVVLDASWLDPAQRDRAAELATRTGSRLTELRCTCPASVAEARILERARRGDDPSEVTVELARELAARAAPWPDGVEIDTSAPVDAAARAAAAVVRRRP